MIFKVLPNGKAPRKNDIAGVYLTQDNWDDWFRWKTMYFMRHLDSSGNVSPIGFVKIGEFGLEGGRPSLDDEFELLTDNCFSLGQTDGYYASLSELGDVVRDDVLDAMNDIAADTSLFNLALREDVTRRSLMRDISRSVVERQFHRIARGGARLTNYEFEYLPPLSMSELVAAESLALNFNVVAESHPPTNIQVVIGRNGVGKTRMLRNMTKSLVDANADPELFGTFQETDEAEEELFTGLVSVSFSAFDESMTLRSSESVGRIFYTVISLRGDELTSVGPSEIAQQFAKSAAACMQRTLVGPWKRAIRMLEGDPIFQEMDISNLVEFGENAESVAEGDILPFRRRAANLFDSLSSGHKIVLLTITRLVQSIEERTLVLIDEPEAHLHPPLLGAFIRTLSDLLTTRNGVAIIATHSPVVLQEVPRTCVWKLQRSGQESTASRPDIETFGENVGVLTREVFGLEVTRSGFHALLRDAVNDPTDRDYDEIVEEVFSNQLGGEARSILRALVADRDDAEDI
jgi:ABC-type transport system involved in cytochrome c biogenesis ATPase subunit